jgi:lysylphosphatidylglycerol synthetase-like protein (DUF2156 family)
MGPLAAPPGILPLIGTLQVVVFQGEVAARLAGTHPPQQGHHQLLSPVGTLHVSLSAACIKTLSIINFMQFLLTNDVITSRLDRLATASIVVLACTVIDDRCDVLLGTAD